MLLEIVLAKKDTDPVQVATSVVAEFSRSPVLNMAEMWVMDQLADIQRAVGLDREREAEKLAGIILKEEEVRRRALPPIKRRRSVEAPPERDYWAEMTATVQSALDEYAERKHLEWTQDLLDTAFALGDGRRIRWGAATVEDHKQRVQLLQGNAVGNLQTAARHLVAIRELEQSGVIDLFTLVGTNV